MKKIAMLLATVLMATSIVACGSKEPAETPGAESPAATETKEITISTKFVDDEQTAISLKKVVEAVNERSNGSLELKLFTGGTLPIGKDGMEQIVKGSDWILVDGVNFLGDYVPDYNAITGPFLYTTFDEYLAMTKTPLVEELNAKIEEDHGVKVMSLDWVFGFRSMMTKKPIKTPEDM